MLEFLSIHHFLQLNQGQKESEVRTHIQGKCNLQGGRVSSEMIGLQHLVYQRDHIQLYKYQFIK